MLVNKQTHFEKHHHQKSSTIKKKKKKKKIESNVWSFKTLSCSGFHSAFVANVESFMFQSEVFRD